MAILSANLANGLETLEAWQIDVPVKSLEILYEGSPVLIEQSGGFGYSPDGTTNVIAQGDTFVGYCLEKCDNSADATGGALSARVLARGVVKLPLGGSPTQAKVGQPVFVNDVTTDSSATLTSDGKNTEVRIGTFIGYIDSSNGYVLIEPGTKAGQAVSPISTTAGFHNLKIVKCHYDFAVQGGAQSTIGLGVTLPVGAVILGANINITTTLTSGGSATIALQAQAANDIKTATAVASWAAGGLAPATAATFGGLGLFITSTAKVISMVIATADLTAGVFDLYLVVANA